MLATRSRLSKVMYIKRDSSPPDDLNGLRARCSIETSLNLLLPVQHMFSLPHRIMDNNFSVGSFASSTAGGAVRCNSSVTRQLIIPASNLLLGCSLITLIETRGRR